MMGISHLRMCSALNCAVRAARDGKPPDAARIDHRDDQVGDAAMYAKV